MARRPRRRRTRTSAARRGRARRDVLVRAGERVPVDGVVLAGDSEIDRSRLTGEPLPAAVGVGDEVWPARSTSTGCCAYASHVRSRDAAGRLAALVEDAAFAKSHAQRLADAVAGVFVPVVIAIAPRRAHRARDRAGLGAVVRAVAVLVVSCPCALGLATPLAVANAIEPGATRPAAPRRSRPRARRAHRDRRVRQDRHTHERYAVVAGVLPADLADETSRGCSRSPRRSSRATRTRCRPPSAEAAAARDRCAAPGARQSSGGPAPARRRCCWRAGARRKRAPAVGRGRRAAPPLAGARAPPGAAASWSCGWRRNG